MMRQFLLILVLLVPSVKAHAGWFYNNICFPDDASAIAALRSTYPMVNGGVNVNIPNTATVTVDAANSMFLVGVMTQWDMVSNTSHVWTNVGLPLSTCTTPTNTVPAVTVGADSNSCFTKGSCNNNDTVQALTVTQDVLIYCGAVLLFFFGFHVGMRTMLGTVERHES